MLHEKIMAIENKAIDKLSGFTGKLPRSTFLCGALGAMVLSIALKCTGHKHGALFMGQWAAPFLLLGMYSKLVGSQEPHEQQRGRAGRKKVTP